MSLSLSRFSPEIDNTKKVTVASALSPQTSGVKGSEPDASKAECLSRDGNAALNQQVFYISVTQVETVVEPDWIADDIGRESVVFVCVHPPIPAI